MSRTIKRGSPPRRQIQSKRRQQPKQSIIDRTIEALPISHDTLRRIATWSIVGAVGAVAIATATWFGVPGAIGVALAEGVGRAGFRVEQVEVTGLSRMDRMTVYAVALDQKSARDAAGRSGGRPPEAAVLWLGRRCACLAPAARYAAGAYRRAQADGDAGRTRASCR